jgi:molybdopterin-guanine dinucleotide biosynthesis protein A
LDKSAIILAGGFSSRFGQDKGLLPLANKPLIKHVLDAISNVVDEKMVVVSSKSQAENYAKIVSSNVKIIVDALNIKSPLVGALTGFKEAMGEYGLLLSCDTPFVSKNILSLLLDLSPNKNAVIPRWPNGYIEPLQAVYCTKPALEASEKALNDGKLDMRSMVDRLRGVRYVSTLVLQQLDPKLKTFFNINSPLDLKRAERILKSEGKAFK